MAFLPLVDHFHIANPEFYAIIKHHPNMKYNFLGNTGLVVSELCFGTMTFGGKGYWEAIGKVQQKEVWFVRIRVRVS